jgi:hypothetical protein
MQFGFGAPVNGPLSGPRDLARIVSEGEAIGYDYCTIGDHVMIPRDMENKSLFRHRRISRPRRPRPERAINLRRLCRGEDIEIAAGNIGHGRASSPAGADRENPRDN